MDAMMPFAIVTPFGMLLLRVSVENAVGMFRSLAAHTTTKLTPNDQLTILPNSVRRKTTPTMMSGSDPSPVMMATASMMPESRLSSVAGMAAPMPNEPAM